MSHKVIINCALTGSVHTPTMSPYLAITLARHGARVVVNAPLGADDAPTRMILLTGAGSFEAAHVTLTQGIHLADQATAAEAAPA